MNFPNLTTWQLENSSQIFPVFLPGLGDIWELFVPCSLNSLQMLISRWFIRSVIQLFQGGNYLFFEFPNHEFQRITQFVKYAELRLGIRQKLLKKITQLVTEYDGPPYGSKSLVLTRLSFPYCIR